MVNNIVKNKTFEEDISLSGFGVKGTSDLNAIETFHLRMDFTNNTVTLRYNPKLIMHRYGHDEMDADEYQSSLEHLKRRIDWCIRKSAGEEPNLNDYGDFN